MHRADKQRNDAALIDEILRANRVCRVGFAEHNRPYLVPLNYGYDGRTIYMHTAREGKKLDILRTNPAVCFEVSDSVELVRAEQACHFGMHYRSVIGFGTIAVIGDVQQKINALQLIMAHHTQQATWHFAAEMVHATTVLAITIDSMTAKLSE
jgi:nitroimidazol reductase NimA-like FMN-containing flavoprotein (pyridoxamine 5'-phosphate oxidase superfamily)